MSFASFALHQKLNDNIRALGYETPTPIQTQAIPAVLAGRDVMGLAQTGTGKTAAFMLPILQGLIDAPRKGSAVRALIVAPTRELAEQINQAARDLGKKTNIRSVTIYGGVSINNQIRNLRGGADIVTACPGRLLDHLRQGTINLSKVETLVLDEADQMFDMGFLPDIKRILSHLPEKRRTLLFSATMPEDIRRLADAILVDPEVVRIGRLAPAETVSHAAYPVPQHLKTPLLIELLRKTDSQSVLIFTKTKHRAKRLSQQLDKQGFAATCLQGNLSQNQRQAALTGFRQGTFKVLVATDIAARGIDINLVSHVINYDVPDTTEAYCHRIGRTGRAAKTGDAFTLITAEDRSMVRAIERVLGASIPRLEMQGFDYRAPAPKRDTEFERPPLPPRRPRSGNEREAGANGRADRNAKGRPGGRFENENRRPARQNAEPASWRGGNRRDGRRPAGRAA